MLYTKNQLKEYIHKEVCAVYEIFKDFFGEDNVDLQNLPSEDTIFSTLNTSFTSDGTVELSDDDLEVLKSNLSNPFIMVYWKEVTATNEFDKSIKIQDLYAKIAISLDGTIPYTSEGFLLNRTTFPKVQFYNRYVHSHVRRFDSLPYFSDPCLGSGPIRQTIMHLRNENDPMAWMLFCQELSLYVKTESIRGVPYIRLETVVYGTEEISIASNYPLKSTLYNRYIPLVEEFFTYYIENTKTGFSYIDNRFEFCCRDYDIILEMSNLFIKYYNALDCKPPVSELFANNILRKVVVKDRKFYTQTSQNCDVPSQHLICHFKGEAKYLKVIPDETTTSENTVTILHPRIIGRLITVTLNVLNFNYKNEHYTKVQNGGETAQSCQKILFV